MKTFVPTVFVVLLAAWVGAACAQDARQPRAREPTIGLPCEGCEAVFEGLPDTLSSVARLTPEAEPGEPMRIEGTVHDQRGHPAPGILWVRVFPGIPNGRRDEPRLRGPEYADP